MDIGGGGQGCYVQLGRLEGDPLTESRSLDQDVAYLLEEPATDHQLERLIRQPGVHDSMRWALADRCRDPDVGVERHTHRRAQDSADRRSCRPR